MSTEPKNEFLEALRKQSRSGLNKLERDWYYDRFISEAKQSDRLVELVNDISATLNEPKETAAEWVLEASAGDLKATARLLEWVPKINALDEAKGRSQYHASRDMAAMILCSRLPTDWMTANRSHLEDDYLVDFDGGVDWDGLKKEKPRSFLSSTERWKVVNAIVEMLPGSITGEIAEFTLNELRDGKPAEEQETEGNDLVAESPLPSKPENEKSSPMNTGNPSPETLPISA
ncbi:MAG: hypothetical protein AAF959_22660 [Cyanobacteria bacterium P01_D01_bin.56]